MSECNENGQCTMPKGHDGPHGVVLGSGILLAPWDNVGETEVVHDATIECDSCGRPMTVRRAADGGGTLSCVCEQQWTFMPNGSSSHVKTTLYPQNPTPQMQLEHLAHLRWEMKAALLLGVPEEKTWKPRLPEIEVAEAKHRAVIAARPWWRFWR